MKKDKQNIENKIREIASVHDLIRYKLPYRKTICFIENLILKERKHACQDMIEYMEKNCNVEWGEVHDTIEVAKEYLKTL